MTEMIQASAEFKKSGYTDEQSAQLAKVASMFQNVADSELSASDSASFIISQMKAFNITAEDSISIVDSVNEVSNTFAVSSTDISSGLTKASASMATYGNTSSQTIGLISAGTEIMTGQAGKISRGLISVGANLIKLADGAGELKYAVDGTTKSIKLFDKAGELKSTYQILSEISEGWNQMSTAEQSSLAISLAGKTQISTFTSVLGNFKTAVEANETALTSQGSASKENEKYMQSLEGRVAGLRTQFENLVLGKGGLQSLSKGLVDVGTLILKFANSDIGSAIIKTSLLIGGMKLAIIAITAFGKSALGTKILLDLMIASSLGLKEGIKLLTITMLKNPLFWGAVAVASIVAITKAFDYFNVTLEEQKELVKETTSKIKELQTEYNKLTSKKNLNESEKERLALLTAELIVLKDQKKEQLALEYSKYKNEANANFQTKDAFGEKSTYTANKVDIDIENYNKLKQQAPSKTLEEDDKLRASKLKNISQLIKEQKELTRYKDVLSKEDKARLKKINTIIADYNATNKSTDANKANVDSLEEEGEGADEARSKLEELQDSLSTLSGMSLTGLTDAFDLMRNAQDEMNSASGLTAETFEQMMNLGSEYLAVLLDQTGALDTTTNAQIALYNAKIDEMVLTASSNQAKLAETQIMENGVGAYANLTQAISNKNAVKMEEILLESQSKGVQGADYDALVSRIYAIRQWGEQAKASIKTSNGFTKSTKSSTKANKENSDSLKELKKNYEKVIGYINDKVDDQIDKLKELKDASLNSIDAQIDKLNEQKDAEEKSWDAKIDALNAQNDAIEQQIELEQLQANLATARNKKVLIYREGRGFGYESDMGAVNDAQKEIDDFNRKKTFEDSIKQLESFKDLASKNYDKQIADLETYRKSVEANYDAQIKYYEDWKNGFKSSVDAYENEQNRLLALQLTGIDFEKANWQARINNLASFVSNWNSLQAQMTNSTPTSSGGGGGSVSAPTVNGGSVTGGVSKPNAKTLSLQKFMNKQFGISSNLLGIWDDATTEAVKQMQKRIGLSSPNGMYNRPTYIALTKYLGRTSGDTSKIPAYASGIASVPDNQMAMVGDNPNTSELVIGSKLNGSMTKLSKGSQVVDAKTTRNIIGLSNSINGSGASYNTYDSNQPINIANLNISVPSITDGKGFSEYINNHLRNEIYQKSKSRG